jgi:hypothetical protein
MRRISLFSGVVALAVTAFPSAAALSAGQPTRTPLGTDSRSWAAGRVCAFPLMRDILVNREVATTFPADANGDVRQFITGYAVAKFTNLDTGNSEVLNVSGPYTVTYHADGSALVDAKGATTYELFVTDTPPGPDEVLSVGRLVIEVTANGDYIVLSQSGWQKSVCADLV